MKAAVIGTGGAARLHMQAYAANPHTHPVAVVSTDAARAAAFAAEFGARGYSSVEEMLERERPEIVSVATLEWDHEAPVLRSLEAGSHVLCEKIMAHTIAVGEAMVAAAHRAGRTLGVNYNYRSVPSHALIREEIARGGFGAPALYSAQMHAYLWPHLLDLLRFFFGNPVEVTAAMVDDQSLRPPVSVASQRPWIFEGEMLYHPTTAVAATMRFREPEFVASMSGSALVPLEENFWSFALYGSKDSVNISRAMRTNLNGVASVGRIAEKIAALPSCSYEHSFHLSVAGFVDAVREGRPAPVTGEDGLTAMRLDAAIVHAAQTGRAVPFPD
ncbi:MAG TPA: Gfo/Idh/MocA family oxidoreductase [Acidobacteriaceae bacterium]|nr:Gfo/Idh/MocA family oxidoreductase [Acidobacteriaceae bacterium]